MNECKLKVKQKITYVEEACGVCSLSMVAKPDESQRTKDKATGKRRAKIQTTEIDGERHEMKVAVGIIFLCHPPT